MLLHYYTHSILFWLGLPNFKPTEDLTKNLQSLDFEYLPREVCIAKCLRRTRMKMLPEMDQQVGVEKVINQTSLQMCRDSCTTPNATPQETKGAATSTVKQIHENYSLNLICRDDSSLHFLIDLHKVNKGNKKIKLYMKNATDITTSSEEATTSSSAYSPSSLLILTSDANKEDANVNGGREGSEGAAGVEEGNAYGTLFVIKIHLANDADNLYAYLSDDNFFTIDKLMANTTYNISVVAVHSNNKYSVIAQQQQFVTLRRSYTPGNVTEIKITDFVEDQVNKMHLSATMMWKPPADMTCHYDIICFSPESEEYDLQPLEIRNPRQLYTYQLDNLTFSSVYKVGIRARNTKNTKESELFWKTFQAPSCVEWYNYNFNICAPDAPQNLHIEQTYVEQYLYSLNITWTLPTHLPDNYTLRIQDLSPQGQLEVYNLTKELHNFFLPQVAIYGVFFEVSLTAYTRGGQSTSTFTDFTKTIVHMPEKNPFVKLIAVILAPIFCVAILSLTIFMIYHRRAKLKRYQERCKYFEELEKKAPIDPKDNFEFRPNNKIVSNELLQYQLDLDDVALFNDEMEIDRNQLTLHEVLGEGAFGLVKRGIYTDTKVGSVLEVAVKMLKDHPSTDDLRAFRREIEVMKSVEKHPNIVGIIGHCTRYGNEMMLLTEYCSFGNLLNFLRDEWRFLHDLQQKKQTLTTSIVDVELPHVTKAQQQQKGLYGGIQFKYDNIHKITTTTTRTTHAINDDDADGGGGQGYQTLNKSKDEGAAATTATQISNKDCSSAVAIEKLNTIDDDVIERFKRKYNDFIATTTPQEQQNYVINNNDNNNHIKLYKSKENLKDLNNETLSETQSAVLPGDDKILTTCVSSDQQTTATSIVVLSPATENKSYGYHGCCTNSCKCDVDVIIRNIDSSDSSKDNEELDRLLQQRQRQQHQFQELQTHATTTCGTTIEIKNCDCKMKEQIVPINPNLKQTEQHYQHSQNSQNNKRNAAVENKTYFKIFNSDKYYLTRKQRLLVADDKETLQQSPPAPPQTPPLHLTAKVKRKSKPPPLPLPPRPVTITTTKTSLSSSTINDDWAATFNRVPLASGDLLDIARQVAVGMDFLAKNKVVHRDLAARNVLVAPDRTVKIADFGLSRDVYQENMYKKTGNGKLPIKWLALESMTHQVYTTQSDVWSYGVLLYEIVTLGATPYPSIPTNRLLHLLKTGYRMEKPKNCGQEFYDLMYSCWNGAPNERPTFHEIIKKLDNMLNNLNNTSSSTASNATDTSVTATIIPDDRDYIKEDNELSKQESPIQQICSDDSYLKPL